MKKLAVILGLMALFAHPLFAQEIESVTNSDEPMINQAVSDNTQESVADDQSAVDAQPPAEEQLPADVQPSADAQETQANAEETQANAEETQANAEEPVAP